MSLPSGLHSSQDASDIYRRWQEERTPNTTQFFQAHRLPAGSTIYGGGDSLYGTFWRSYVNNTSRLRELWEAGQRTFVVA